MRRSAFLATAEPGRGQWIAALLTVAGLAAAAAIVLPFGSRPMPPNPGFLLALGAMALFADGITAALLFSQAHASRDRSTVRLGIAFLFAGAMVVPYLLQIPGTFGRHSLLGGPSGAFWLWSFRNAGFACCIGTYAWRHGKSASSGLGTAAICAATLGVVIASTCLIDSVLPFLPAVHDADALSAMVLYGAAPVLMILNAAALAAVVVRLRGRTTVSLWLAVAIATSLVDVLMILNGGHRFTLAWYAGKILDVATGSIVLVALMTETTILFNRMVGLNVELLCTAFHDDLTKLPNRAFFLESLDGTIGRARHEGTCAYAVMFIDLDRFKAINDNLGHHAGDLLLVEVARRLKSCLRPQDTVARIGGDEFAIIVEDVSDVADAVALAMRINRTMRRRMRLAGHEIHPSCSIGIVQGAEHYGRPEELLHDADSAMYASKRKDVGNVTVFKPSVYDTVAASGEDARTAANSHEEAGPFSAADLPALRAAVGILEPHDIVLAEVAT